MKYITCLLVGTLLSAYATAEAADTKIVVNPVQPAQRTLFSLTDVRLGDSQFTFKNWIMPIYYHWSRNVCYPGSGGRQVLLLMHLLILSGSPKMSGVVDLWPGILWAFRCLPCQ